MSAEMFAAGPACAQGAACWIPLAAAAGVGAIVGFVAGLAVGKSSWKGRAKAKRSSARRAASQSETRTAIPPTSVEIYVGNLSYDLDEKELRKMFEKFGEVSTARIVTNRYNNKSKGFGFVVMPNRPEAEKAIAAYEEKEFMGRKMKVNEARNTLKTKE